MRGRQEEIAQGLIGGVAIGGKAGTFDEAELTPG